MLTHVNPLPRYASGSTITRVAAATVDTLLLAANTDRAGGVLFNESNKTCYVKLGDVATVTSYTVQLYTNSYYQLPVGYTGIVKAIWANGASGSIQVTELVP